MVVDWQGQSKKSPAQTIGNQSRSYCLRYQFQRFLIENFESTGLAQHDLWMFRTGDGVHDDHDNPFPAPLSRLHWIALEAASLARKVEPILAQSVG